MTSDENILRIVSVSGGKDSTALYCWAIEQWGKDGFTAVFADTGNEHPVTLNYLRNLPAMAGGPEIVWVKSDWKQRLSARGKSTSGSVFLDMMIVKGRAPSTKAQFCTGELKIIPIRRWIDSIAYGKQVESYTGIRAGESTRRSMLLDSLMGTDRKHGEGIMEGITVVFPLIKWSEQNVFEYLKDRNVTPNPLYALGYKRVGCFPCIHAQKSELARLPKWAWDKIESWELEIGRTWFPPNTVPGKYIVSVSDVKEWCKTQRGGWRFELFTEDERDSPSCMSTWGVCE